VSTVARFALVCVAAAFAAAAAAQDRLRDRAADSIDFAEKPFQEDRSALPTLPKDADLIRFDVGPAQRGFEFFVDGASLAVGTDEVVRYTVVARSDSGASNVSYEGIRCRTRERKVYAYGRSDGKWAEARNSDWMKIGAPALEGHIFVLYSDFFCPGRDRIRDAAEGLAALKRGRHPKASDETGFRDTPLGN